MIDASGKQWFTKKYESLSSKYAYDASVPQGIDPFQSIYKQISDDMQAYRLTLTEADVARIRTVAEMVFAHDFAPDAFSSYIESNKNGQITVKRLPAPDDPDAGANPESARTRIYRSSTRSTSTSPNTSARCTNRIRNGDTLRMKKRSRSEQLEAQARARMIAGIGGGRRRHCR